MFPLQSPSTRIGYTLCTIEHFVGLMMSSCLLGIVFARASIPTARMAFSKVCLITTRSVLWYRILGASPAALTP